MTLADLAQRVASFDSSSLKYSYNSATSILNASVTATDAGKFALDLGDLGTSKIKSVAGWYAYDDDSVFVDRDGGTYSISLGATPDDVTHLYDIADRAELLSVSGDGKNLNFSVVGEGKYLVDLANPTGQSVQVTSTTDTAFGQSLVGDKLTLTFNGLGTHTVSVNMGESPSTIYNGTSAPDSFIGNPASLHDSVSYGQSPSGLFASLENPERNTGWAAGDSFVYIEGLSGSEFNDILAGNNDGNAHNELRGLGGNDLLYGLIGGDNLYGGSGNDILEGGASGLDGIGDLLDGGDGYDYAAYQYAPAGVRASILTPSTNTGDAAGDQYVSIEGLIGSIHNDVLVGSDTDPVYKGHNEIYGGAGNDSLYGMGGNDSLWAGTGENNLYGGTGGDGFAFYNTDLQAGVVNRILDFSPSEFDEIDFVNVNSSQISFTNYAGVGASIDVAVAGGTAYVLVYGVTADQLAAHHALYFG